MKFGLQPIDVERRSKVYWELYVLELLECLSHGRPSTFSLVPADVPLPACSDTKTDCAYIPSSTSHRAIICHTNWFYKCTTFVIESQPNVSHHWRSKRLVLRYLHTPLSSNWTARYVNYAVILALVFWEIRRSPIAVWMSRPPCNIMSSLSSERAVRVLIV
jgi:hypothetical protein